MKFITFAVTIVFISSVFVNAADENDFKRKYMSSLLHSNLNIKDSNITISDEDDEYTILITEDCDLYVNGRYVKLDRDQQKLVDDYHETILEIVDRAKDIGIEGAKLGVDGAKIGLQAVVGVFKLLGEDYDSDDLEAELEDASEDLEEKAAELEAKAEKLDLLSENLDEIHEELKGSIPELEDLDSF